MLTSEQSNILTLLCTCQDDNIALAEELAKGLNINILEILEQEGFLDLGIVKAADFGSQLLEGEFRQRNIINLQAIQYFPDLTCLDCSMNKLSNLQGLENCTDLAYLDCCKNNLTSLQGIEHSTTLMHLDCANNQLMNLSELECCVGLEILVCNANKIETLAPLYKLPNLRKIYAENNPRLSEAEIARFREHQPNCKIIC